MRYSFENGILGNYRSAATNRVPKFYLKLLCNKNINENMSDGVYPGGIIWIFKFSLSK
jgi:hypothetical protein